MTWSSLSNLFGASDSPDGQAEACRKPSAPEPKEVKDQQADEEAVLGSLASSRTFTFPWEAVLLDLQSCGLRNRSDPAPTFFHQCEILAHAAIEREHALVEIMEETLLGSHIPDVLHQKQAPVAELDTMDDTILGPFGKALPCGVMKRIATMLKQEETTNPYAAREIAERAGESLRYQFIKQCELGHKDRCIDIWDRFKDRERRDFYQACQVGAQADEIFFTYLVEEPDAFLWCSRSVQPDALLQSSLSDKIEGASAPCASTDCSSSASESISCDLEDWSDNSSGVEGSVFSIPASVRKHTSVSSQAPRRRFAK